MAKCPIRRTPPFISMTSDYEEVKTMKKRSRKFFSIMMAIVILSVCFVVPVNAETAGDDGVSPTMLCTDCYVSSKDICMGVGKAVAQTTHSYSGGTCYVVHYGCESMEWCPSCYSCLYQYGWHDCYSTHSSCGKGRVNICPCGYPPSGYEPEI